MKLSLSARIAERFYAKREAALSLSQLCGIAVSAGYGALCMRASQVGVQSSAEHVHAAATVIREHGLGVSMVTGDFAIPENSTEGPSALRNITPYLDLAESLDCRLLRVALREEGDVAWARRAADEAAERGMRLAHQCHNKSLFELIEVSLEVLRRIDRPNFGLTYEPANLELCGQPYGRAALHRLAPHLFNVYLQNQRIHADGATEMVTWCRGTVRFDQIPVHQAGGIDFEEILFTLREVGYEGWITVHDASLGRPREDAEETARLLQRIWRKTRRP